MDIVPVYSLKPGMSADVSANNRFVRINGQDGVELFNLFPSPGEPMNAEIGQQVGVEFSRLVEIPQDARKRVGIARADIKPDDEFSRDALMLIRKGIPYETNLVFENQGASRGSDIEVVITRVLQDRENVLSTIALLYIRDEEVIGEDENIVAVLDVLGFSETMSTESLDDIENKLVNGLIGALSFTQMYSGGLLLNDSQGNLCTPKLAVQIERGIMSDTIVLYPKKHSSTPFWSLVEAVSITLDMAQELGWLLRGAIDVDSFRVVDEHAVFIGKALLNAHRLEQAQEWSGCILSEGVQSRFPAEVSEMKRKGIVVDFEVPFKKPPAKVVARNYPAVNWCYFETGWGNLRIPRLEAKLATAPREARRKISETLMFAHSMQSRGLFSTGHIRMTMLDSESEADNDRKRVGGAFSRPVSRDGETTEPLHWTNGISPVHILIYEDFTMSSRGICASLTDLDIGAIVACTNEGARDALRRFPGIKLYVSDHHSEVGGGLAVIGLERIDGCLFQRDYLKKNHSRIPSVLLVSDPNGGLAKGFRRAGGNYVVDCSNKTAKDIARTLKNIMHHGRS